MKIRTQSVLTLSLFGLLLVGMAASLILTTRQVDRLNQQEAIAARVERGAVELSYLSGDYLMYGESQQRARWESSYASFSEDVSRLTLTDPGQRVLVAHIQAEQAQLEAVFTDITSTLETASRPTGDALVPGFVQISWSRMAIQSQAIAFDASRLSRQLRDQADRLEQTSHGLNFALIGVFGAYLLANYHLVYRRTLRSIADLQAGTEIVGSGNLDFVIGVGRADEIGELSRAFNRMTSNLAAVMASKADLERDIAERTRAEQHLLESSAELQAANTALWESRRAALNLMEDALAARQRAERHARRTDRLQALAAALSRALTPAEVGEVVVRLGAEAVGASAWLCYRLAGDGEALELLGEFGFPQALVEPCRRLPLSLAAPLPEAVRTGQAVWLESHAAHEARFPQSADQRAVTPEQAVAALPLAVEDRVLGGIQFSLDEERRFEPEDQEYLQAIARQAAQALERARLFEAERRAVADADRERTFVSAVLDTAGMLVMVLDSRGRIVRFNRACEMLTGYAFDEARGRCVWDFLLVPEEVEPVKAVFAQLRAGQFSNRHEHHWLTRDGGRRWIAWSNTVLLDAQGEVEHVIATGIDLTEQRQAEEQLRKLSRAVEASANSILITDVAGNIEYVNPKFTQVTGYAPGEVLGRNPRVLKSDRTPPEEYERLWTTIKAGGEWRGEFLNRKKNGELYWELASISPITDPDGAITHFVAVKEDITDRKRVEAALQDSEERYRRLVEASPDAIVVHSEGRIAFANAAAARLVRATSPDEMIGKPVMGFVPPEYRGLVQSRVRQVQEAGQAIPLIEEKFLRLDGSLVDVEVAGIPFVLDDRPASQLVVRDITERKQAERALADEKERLAVTLRSIGDGVIATDTDGRVVLMNPVAEQLTGWDQAEALGRPVAEVFQIIHEHTRALPEDPVAKVLRIGDVVGLANHTALIARDGTERAIADSGAPIRDEGGQVLGAVLVFRDVTEKRRLDAELAKANKLDALGVLAGGIAHDFNNILTAILANTSLARMAAEPGTRPYQWLTEVEKASRRAKELTHQLLTFAKGGAPIRQPASLRELLHDTATFAVRGSNVQAEVALAADLWPAEVDAGQIGQVIQNLVLNAQQAMPGGGTVRVSAENETLGERSGLPLAPGRYVKVTVADCGVGIPAGMLARIFDPFFTTKPAGSGLGLATAYSIVQRHSGHIAVESTEGVGTTFTVHLPAAERALPVSVAAGEAVQGGRGRVLAMDDDASVRALLVEALGMLGFEVTPTADGTQAVEAYRRALEAGEGFDVVILDLTVPGGLGGRDALRLLQQIDPGVKAIASSGYATDPILADFPAHGFRGVVAKPYSACELSRVVGGVIGE